MLHNITFIFFISLAETHRRGSSALKLLCLSGTDSNAAILIVTAFVRCVLSNMKISFHFWDTTGNSMFIYNVGAAYLVILNHFIEHLIMHT
ncbi:hypothetical protein RchiOBHm_Chr2g0146171 [Rosa chinensis]|uniref:Uncharacterized protein n=1 Tax=Rosa chinensis TaxID=74649 RepID=A0A2P6RYU1_ROSCH|nr:hypothetical protein RchiOBHm_Chr2g0146171 [Rosa chinensis]